MKGQIQIYEYGKFVEPGSMEDEFALALCRDQMKSIGSKLSPEIQMLVTAAMIKLIAELGENSAKPMIKQVMGKFQDVYVQVNVSRVGRIMEEQIPDREHALLAHSSRKDHQANTSKFAKRVRAMMMKFQL